MQINAHEWTVSYLYLEHQLVANTGPQIHLAPTLCNPVEMRSSLQRLNLHIPFRMFLNL